MVSIIVVFPKAADARGIRNTLVRSGYQVAAVCTSGAQALQIADGLDDGIVVCGYRFHDMIYSQLKECLPCGIEMLLIASEHILEECRDRDVMRLPLPLKVHDMVSTLDMMIGGIRKRKKKAEQKPKVRTEKEKNLIREAKQILMERNSMTEEEAHRYMQKCSMDSGTNLVETAEMIFSLMR